MTIDHAIVIGGMKCGTTTLYHDLLRVEGLAIPDKELNFFQRPEAEVSASAYDALFAGVAGTCRVDVSTTYTMWPDVPDVPERAAEVLGGRARLIYMVRDPLERAISHHHHMVARGATSVGFEDYLARDRGVIEYGRYDVQAKRWIDSFGDDALLIVRLDDYAGSWETTMPTVLAHLGVSADVAELGRPEAMNVTDEARVFTGAGRWFADSRLFAIYSKGVRRLVPPTLRARLRNAVLPEPPPRPDPPRAETLRMLVDEFDATADWVAARTGSDRWDLAASADSVEAGAR